MNYHKVIATNPTDVAEYLRTAFVEKETGQVLVTIDFANDKQEALKMLVDKPTMVVENNFYYVDIDWLINNATELPDRQEVLNKVKSDIVDFVQKNTQKPKE